MGLRTGLNFPEYKYEPDSLSDHFSINIELKRLYLFFKDQNKWQDDQ